MPADRPNVLLFLTDQHRADWLGHTPAVPVRTPTIDGVARQGVRFSNAFCAANPCAPSRACLASGKRFGRSPVAANDEDYPLDHQTLYGRLREAGYRVLGAGKLDLLKDTPFWGTDGRHRVEELGFSDAVNNAGNWDAILGLAGEFDWPPTEEDWARAAANADDPNDPYMAYLNEEGLAETHVEDHRRRMAAGYYGATFPTPLPARAYCDNWLARNGLALLEGCPVGEPWFLAVNFVGPHAPMNVTEGMHGWYRDPDIEFPLPVATADHPVGTEVLTPPSEYAAADHQETRRNYAAMIENVDRWLERYLEAIEGRGELEETIVVFTADHGEMLGDHNKWAKGFPYHPSIRVPLVVAGPGVEAGAEDALVSLIDLYATLCAAAGVAPPGDVDSRSLWPLLSGDADGHRSHLHVGKSSWRVVFDGRYKLVDWRGDREWIRGDTPGEGVPDRSLFDLHVDPKETTDLATQRPAVVRRLAGHLDS